MAFKDIFFRSKRNDDQPQATPEEAISAFYWDAGALQFGQNFSTYGSLNLSSVFSAVSLISNSIARLPINVKLKGADVNDLQNSEYNDISNALTENPVMSKYTMMRQMMHDLLLYGNAFMYIQRSGDEIVGLQYMPRGTVSIIYNQQTQSLTYNAPSVSNDSIYPEDMIHLLINGEDGVNGKGIISYACRTIKTSDATEQSASDFFSGGCNISGLLKVNGPIGDAAKKDMKKNWEQTYGKSGKGGVAVLGGDVDYQAISARPVDSQMVESREWNLTEVARFFNLSPVMLGDLTHSSYSTIEAANIQYLTHTLQPYITLIEDEFNRKLCTGLYKKYIIDLDESFILTADKTALSNFYGNLVDKGILTRNEVRRALGYPDMDGADTLTVSYSDPKQNALDGNKEESSEEDKDKTEKN